MSNNSFRDNSLFTIFVWPTNETPIEKVEELVMEIIAQVKEKGVTPEEVEKAKAKLLTNLTFRRDSTLSIASSLNEGS